MVVAAPPPPPPTSDPAKSQGNTQASGADDAAHSSPGNGQTLSIEEMKAKCSDYCRAANPFYLSECVTRCETIVKKCTKTQCPI